MRKLCSYNWLHKAIPLLSKVATASVPATPRSNPNCLSSLLFFSLCSDGVELWCPDLLEALKPYNCQQGPAKTRLGYLKTHKTASSTLAGIVFRFGLEQDLRFLLSDRPVNLMSPKQGQVFTNASLAHPWHSDYLTGKQYQMFGQCAVWNYKAFRYYLSRVFFETFWDFFLSSCWPTRGHIGMSTTGNSNPVMTLSAGPVSKGLFWPRFRAPPAYTASQLPTLHQHRANNQ